MLIEMPDGRVRIFISRPDHSAAGAADAALQLGAAEATSDKRLRGDRQGPQIRPKPGPSPPQDRYADDCAAGVPLGLERHHSLETPKDGPSR